VTTGAGGDRPWRSSEIALLVGTAGGAPTFGTVRPWIIYAGQGSVSVYERFRGPAHRRTDPTGHNRLLACGAALATVLVAVRVLGRDAGYELYPDPRQPDEVGRIDGRARIAPTDDDHARFQAVSRIGPASPAQEPTVPAVSGVRVVPVPALTSGARYLLVTDEDRSRDRVLAGMAAQQLALTARAAGWSVQLTGLPTAQELDGPGRAQVEVRLHSRAGAAAGRTHQEQKV
jgi:hypothetical protein